MNKIWILTKEFGGYESNGDIYIAAFANKPTCEDLSKFIPESMVEELVYDNFCLYDNCYYKLEEDDLI